MPMKSGHSKEVVRSNIQEMMRAGHSQKQAVAAALHSARKSKKLMMADGGQVPVDNSKRTLGEIIGYPGFEKKKADAPKPAPAPAEDTQNMAHGGEVSEDMDEGLSSTNDEGAERSISQLQAEGAYHPEAVENPDMQDHDRMLAKALYKKGEKDEMMSYAKGGLVEDDHDESGMGNIPDEDMEAVTGEPMADEPMKAEALGHSVIEGVPEGMGLSKEAMSAIAERKKRRRFS